MVWNYRVVRHRYGEDEYYHVHAAYYDSGDNLRGRPRAISKEPISAGGGSIDELRVDLRKQIEAFDKDVLEYDTFINKDEEHNE